MMVSDSVGAGRVPSKQIPELVAAIKMLIWEVRVLRSENSQDERQERNIPHLIQMFT